MPKINVVSLSCQGKNWQDVLPVITFELLGASYSLENLVCSGRSFILNFSGDDNGGDVDEWDFLI